MEQRTTRVLDPIQLVRIEAVHRGFLFQHLYAAQCLLTANALMATSISVENDEDIEVELPEGRTYLQVKYRKDSLAWSDVEDALTRFGQLRGTHASGERHGKPTLLIVSNAAPNGPLASRLGTVDWPGDVQIVWPTANREPGRFPIPQASLLEAAEAARRMAEKLPFATLAPETLVWKLAGLVSLAATGDDRGLSHTFKADQLPALFEQLLVQLQDLPLPPSPYRVQENEPALSNGERVRLIVGYSGAGKTSWLAQSAQHAPGKLVYLDVADIPSAAIANAAAREIAGRMFASGGGLERVLLPGASGRELLQAMSRRLARQGEHVTVALDNVHHASADDLVAVIQAARDLRFVLLGRPEGDIATLEAIVGIAREGFDGWSPDTAAAAAYAEGCHGDAADCQRLIDLTGGLPLFVLNAVSVAKADYDGLLKRFCADLDRSAHTRETAQDLILGRVFERLPGTATDIAELLSLCDVPLKRDEARSYVATAGGCDPASYDSALRHLIGKGLLQVFANDRIKLHDAARAVGKGRLALKGAKALEGPQGVLWATLEKNLLEDWHPAKLSLFLRLTGEVGRFDVLVELATDEHFHEMGVWFEVEPYLVQGSRDESVPPDQRIKALDGLAFADLKVDSSRAGVWLDQMDALIEAQGLGAEDRLRVGMKRMALLAREGDRRGAIGLISELEKLAVDLSRSHQRILHYNIAWSELKWGDAEAAADRVEPLISEYYDLIGLSPALVLGNNAPELARMLGKDVDLDVVKHLADTLDLFAKANDALDRGLPLVRIHALKFYDLARATESLFRVGQDLVDQFVKKRDFTGALNVVETLLLPQLQNWKLVDYIIPVRSQYAVVLAYCGRHSEADAEMRRLEPYKGSLSAQGLWEIRNQEELIFQIRTFGPPPQWIPAPGLLEGIAEQFQRAKLAPDASRRQSRRKVGRNDPCSCGSGRKFKHCHGRSR